MLLADDPAPVTFRQRDVSPYDRSRALLALDLRLQRGETPEQAIAFLVSLGFSAEEARADVERMTGGTLAATRKKGWIWLGWGAACIFAGAAITWAFGSFFHAISPRHSAVGRVPLLLFGAGTVICARGVKLIFSREYSSNPD